MIISCIVAVDNKLAIGKGNEIPWYLPADLKYFKKKTLDHHIIMGRKCYESIGKPLPKRTNIIVTRNPFYIVSNCLVVHNVEEALYIAAENGDEEVFIIGGGMIYDLTKDLWDRLYLTEVDVEIENPDVYFPSIDKEGWKLVSEESHQKDEKNEFDYTFKVFHKE